jgi:hypothetical protein
VARAFAAFAALSYEGNIRGDGLLVVAELVAETGGEEVVFDAHTDLRAGQEDKDCRNEQTRGRNHEAGAQKDAEHRSVDGVTDQTVGTGAHKFVIRAEGGIEAQVSPEGARAGPGQENCKREKEDGERSLPGFGRSGPKMALP